MLQRLKTLTLMQLNFSKFKTNLSNKKKAVVAILLRVLGVCIVTVAMFFIFMFLEKIIHIKVDEQLLLFVLGLTQIFSIISSTLSLCDQLYLSKDNLLLLSYPVKHSEIFFSKLINNYIKEFYKNLFFLVPIIISFGIFSGDFLYFLNGIILIVILPLFSVVIGGILSIPFSFVKRVIKTNAILQTTIYLLFIFAIFYLIFLFLNKLPKPLRILALYNSFIKLVEHFIIQFNSALLFYRNTVFLLFSFRAYYDYLIAFGSLIGLFLVLVFLVRPLYFKIVSLSQKMSAKKHSSKYKKNGVFLSFLTKEFRAIFRIPGKLSSLLSFAISFPFLMYIMNTIFMAINTSELGNLLIVGFNVVISLILITASNTQTAVSITSEGEEFAVLKTAPTQTYKIVYAKIIVNAIFSTIGIVLGMIVLGLITNIESWQIVCLFWTIFFVNLAHIIWSFQLDIINPRLSDFSRTRTTNHNPNIAKSLLVGLLISIIFGAISLFFFFELQFLGWTRVIFLAMAFLLVRIYLFYINLRVYFKRIEL